MLLISDHIFDLFYMLRSRRKWNTGKDIHPEDKTSYTTQFQEAILMCVENEYSAKHRCVLVNKLESIPSSSRIRSTQASRSYQSSFDHYDLSTDDKECLTPTNGAETTRGQSNCVAG